MADAPDALSVMRRSMVASHNAAAAESRKGKRASPEKIAAALAQAADMAKSIAAVEDRRGIAPAGPSRFEIELVPNLRGLTDAELQTMGALIRKTHAAMIEAGEAVPEASPAEIEAHRVVAEFADSFKALCAENSALRDTRDHLHARVSELCRELEHARLDAARVAGAPAPGRGVDGDGEQPPKEIPQPRPGPVTPDPKPAGNVESIEEYKAREQARKTAAGDIPQSNIQPRDGAGEYGALSPQGAGRFDNKIIGP